MTAFLPAGGILPSRPCLLSASEAPAGWEPPTAEARAFLLFTVDHYGVPAALEYNDWKDGARWRIVASVSEGAPATNGRYTLPVRRVTPEVWSTFIFQGHYRVNLDDSPARPQRRWRWETAGRTSAGVTMHQLLDVESRRRLGLVGSSGRWIAFDSDGALDAWGDAAPQATTDRTLSAAKAALESHLVEKEATHAQLR